MKMLAELSLRALKLINLLCIANIIVQDEHHRIAAFDHLDQLCLFQLGITATLKLVVSTSESERIRR